MPTLKPGQHTSTTTGDNYTEPQKPGSKASNSHDFNKHSVQQLQHRSLYLLLHNSDKHTTITGRELQYSCYHHMLPNSPMSSCLYQLCSPCKETCNVDVFIKIAAVWQLSALDNSLNNLPANAIKCRQLMVQQLKLLSAYICYVLLWYGSTNIG